MSSDLEVRNERLLYWRISKPTITKFYYKEISKEMHKVDVLIRIWFKSTTLTAPFIQSALSLYANC